MRALLTMLAMAALIYAVPVTAQDTTSGQVEFKPEQMRFPSVAMGQCRPKKIEAINNTGAAIANPGFRVEDSNVFRVQKRGKCPNPLEPGQTCRGYVNFCPPLFHTYEATLLFSGSTQKIQLIGRGFQRSG